MKSIGDFGGKRNQMRTNRKEGRDVEEKAKFLAGFFIGVVIVLILRRDKWLPLIEVLIQHL